VLPGSLWAKQVFTPPGFESLSCRISWWAEGLFLNGSEVLIIPIAAWPSELGLVRPVLRGLVLNLSGARANLDPPPQGLGRLSLG